MRAGLLSTLSRIARKAETVIFLLSFFVQFDEGAHYRQIRNCANEQLHSLLISKPLKRSARAVTSMTWPLTPLKISRLKTVLSCLLQHLPHKQMQRRICMQRPIMIDSHSGINRHMHLSGRGNGKRRLHGKSLTRNGLSVGNSMQLFQP